jgi:5-methylcytosine-specific restriction endonuclease McrA
VKVPSGVRATVLSRDKGRCVRCDVSVLNRPSSVHHRLPRRMGGTKDERSADPRNLVTLCGTGTTGCHGEVESYRALAYDTGWVIRSYEELDDVLYSKDGRRITLLVDGDRDDVIDVASVIAAEAMQ